MAIKTFILALCLFASQLYATEFGDIPATTDVSTLWVPPSRTLTIGGSTLSLSADRTWTATTILDSISTTQGVVLYRGASSWSALATSTAGNVLTTHGASANPTWSPLPSIAPATAHYVTTQAESGLSNEFSLGSLGSGILKQAVSSSISTPAIATSGTDYAPATSGSSILKGSSGGFANAVAADVVGLFSTCSGTQYLGADGACHNAGSTVTPAALSKADDTNVTLTLTGTPTTALLQATTITAGWTGTLSVARGGSGAGTLTGLVLGNGTSSFTTVTAPSGTVVGTTDTQTLTNKWVKPRSTATPAPGATPAINTDNFDVVKFTSVGTAITSMTTSLTGTPVIGQKLLLSFTDDGTARGITWGASFQSGPATLLATTVISKQHWVGLVYDGSKWTCFAVDATGY